MAAYRDRLADIWGNNPGDPSQALAWIIATVGAHSTEDIYLDFKRKANEAKAELDDPDKNNLGKSISAFANTGGGLIIWGVYAAPAAKGDPDAVQSLHPIQHLLAFTTNLRAVSGGATDPPVPGIEHRAVPTAPGGDVGYVITIVPKMGGTLTQANMGKHNGKFFLRTGAGVAQIPQMFFAEFFARKPLPELHFRVRFAEPANATIKEEVIEAEHWPENSPSKYAAKRPWGRCKHAQSLSIEWVLEVQNDGRGTAFDVVVWARGPGMVTGFAVDRRHEGVDRVLHPGQSLVVHHGALVVPAAAFLTGANYGDFLVEANAYATDAPGFPFAHKLEGAAIVERYRDAFSDKAPPAERDVPDTRLTIDI